MVADEEIKTLSVSSPEFYQKRFVKFIKENVLVKKEN